MADPHGPRDRRAWTRRLAWAAPFAAGVLLFFFFHSRPFAVPEALVDMTVLPGGGDPGRMELFVNDLGRTPGSAPLISGQRRTYSIPLADIGEVRMLRLDPGEAPGVTVVIHGIRLMAGGEVRAVYGPADMARWGRANVAEAVLEERGLRLTPATNDPSLMAQVGPVDVHSSLLAKVAAYCSLPGWRDPALFLLVVALCGWLVLGASSRDGALRLGAVALGVGGAYALACLVLASGGRPPDPAGAVGLAAYLGYPKSADLLCVATLLAIPLAMGAAALVRARLRAPRTGEIPPPPARNAGVHALALGAAAAAVWLLVLPDLAGELRNLEALRYSPQWDAGNILAWDFFFQTGSRPFVDFWYPYGGHILGALPFPLGSLFTASNLGLMWTVLLLSLYLVTGRNLWASLAFFGLYAGLDAIGVFWAPQRYALIIGNVALSYAGLDWKSRRWQPGHVLFWIAVFQAGFLDPTNLFYSGLPVLALLCIRAAGEPRAFFQGLAGRCLREFLVPVLGAAALAAFLASQGLLGGVADLYARLGEVSGYAAIPAEVRSWLGMVPFPEGAMYWAGALLSGIGLFGLLCGQERERPGWTAVFLLGAAEVLLLLKQMYRPHMAWQMVPLAVLGFLALALAARFRAGRGEAAWMAALAGVLAGVFWGSGLFDGLPGRLRAAWANLPSTAGLALMDAARREEIVALRFSPAKFQAFPAQLAVAEALERLHPREREPGLFVLGDDQVLYILGRRRPLRHVNLYDASPVSQERRVADLLAREQPPMVWPGSPTGIDGLPVAVRDPILLDAAVRLYVPEAALGRFVILRPRRSWEPVALGFWTQALGPVLDLKHLPRFTSLGRFGACPGEDADCARFLRVRLGSAPAAEASLAVPVEVAGGRYEIRFTAVPGQQEYVVNLDRVWFHGALRRAGLAPRLDAVPGLDMDFFTGKDPGNVLY